MRLDAEWSKCKPKAIRGEYPLSQSIVVLQDQTAAAIKQRIDDSSNAAVGENAKRITDKNKLIEDEDLTLAKEDCTPVKRAEIQAKKQGRVDRAAFVSKSQAVIEAHLGAGGTNVSSVAQASERIDANMAQISQNMLDAENALNRVMGKKGTGTQYPDSELEYPLMRLNALLDNISSKLDK